LGTWAARGALQPLDEIITNLGITDEDFPAAVWQGFEYNGQRYGIPLDIHPLTFYVNMDLLAEAGIDKIPTNKEEFEAAAEAMTQGNVKGYTQPVLWPGFLIGQALLFQNGGRLVDETGQTAAFNSEAGRIAMQQLVDWNQAGFSTPEVAIDAQANAFRAGTNAMTMDGIWMIQGFRDAGVNFEAAPIPQFGPEPGTWAGSHQLTIPAHKAGEDPCKVAAAGELIGYLTENSAVWAQGGQIPARLSARNSPEFAEVLPQANVAPSVDFAVFPPPVPGIGDALFQWEQAVNWVLSGEKDIETALADAEANANQLLEENRAKYAAPQQ
jgi:multiple sugar transport system substrate-binding protein